MKINEIEIYWWNMGKKTLDFVGSYEDFRDRVATAMNDLTGEIKAVNDGMGLFK